MPMVFGPSLRALLEDMMELLTRELLKILLQERLLDENQGKYDLTDQVNIDLGGRRCSEQKGSRSCAGDGSTSTAPRGAFLSLPSFLTLLKPLLKTSHKGREENHPEACVYLGRDK